MYIKYATLEIVQLKKFERSVDLNFILEQNVGTQSPSTVIRQKVRVLGHLTLDNS